MALLHKFNTTTNALETISDAEPLPVTAVVGTGSTDLGKEEDTAHASGDVGVMMLGVRNDSGATALTGSNGDYTPISTTVRGEVFAVSALKATNGVGTSLARLISAATTNATVVKASAATLFSIYAFNTNAAARYLKLYNKATAPTVGTDTPVMTILLPPSVPVNINSVFGITFTSGLSFALTTGIADTDTTAVAANEIVVNTSYV